ncbi:mannosyl phosphorylinositol ceramide synthase SUR1 [Arthroderma uncinatum]|uniref:mannosyl phosphorylinositol ceramide synthase SUR1 n=1 Tax=Arthroderma uncinatum TaxID=74035 RepID=UPI00144ABF84|nr:mannosyl phosphorylinositol ceramide synthase SUR1 [Arthroderma uncinatum]KAF3482493.1 mannosyl phosphorylinositol ceramide synthase SUR1 [Arthroderma uncinatum]
MSLFGYIFSKRRQARNLSLHLLNFAWNAPVLVTVLLLFLYIFASSVYFIHFVNSVLNRNSLSLDDLPQSYVKTLDEAISKHQPTYNVTLPKDDLATPIPHIIHRTYKTPEFPEIWQNAYNSCQILLPEYTHYFWTDETARQFIETKFPWFLPTYDGYRYGIQRVDSLRYFLLWHYGGVYLDLDVGCRRDIRPLLEYPALLPRTWPFGVSNDVMASSPGHPLMIKAALSLHEHNVWYISKYITVFFTTGPMFLCSIIASWHRLPRADGNTLAATYKEPHGLAIIPTIFYDTTEYAFFSHFPGSTWHGNDVAILSWLYHYLWIFILAGFALMITSNVLGYTRRARRRIPRFVLKHELV